MEKKRVSFISKLKFDPKLNNTLQAKYLKNIRLVILLTLTIIILGTSAFFTIPKRVNPEIKIPIVIVNTILPGASPEDIESLVTIPLEDSLKSVKGLDKISSVSNESSSTITLQFLSTVDGEKARSDTQSLVDSVSKLPDNAKKPKVLKLDFEDKPVWTFIITSTSDNASLMRFAKVLKKDIEGITKVDRVTTTGQDSEDIEIIINPEKMQEYKISPFTLAASVQKAAGSYPAGTVNTGRSSFLLTIDKEVTKVEDIRNLRITVGDQNVRLGDIASISNRTNANQTHTYIASATSHPKQGVQFFVYKTSNANIDASEKDARTVVDATLKKYNGQFKLQTVMNTADDITTQFGDLFIEFLSTVALVFILLFIFLGLRQAIIASITVPLTMLSALAIINAMGLTLNFLTTFAFLIALGLLIDDTIVTVAAMTRYYKTGNFTPTETGLMVWRDFIVPLWSTTIATIWAFLPLLLATGIIGEFIKSIPIVVTATLLSSTTIAVLITIPLMIIFLKPAFPRRVVIMFRVLGILIILGLFIALTPKSPLTPVLVVLFVVLMLVTYRVRAALRKEYDRRTKRSPFFKFIHKHTGQVMENGLLDIERLSNVYRRVIDKIIHSKSARRKTILAIVVFAIVAYVLLAAGVVTNEFFPKSDADVIYISVKLPAGTNLDTTNTEALNLMDKIRKTEIVDYVVADIGQSLQADSGGRDNDSSSILYTLHLPSHKIRHVSSSQIAEKLKITYKDYARGTFLVQELSGGPPAGSDIQIKLLGEDLSVLDKNADKLAAFLNKQPGVSNVQKSIKPGISKLVFQPDKTKLAEEQISVDTIGLQLRSYTQGFTLDTIKLGSSTEDQDIILRQNAYSAQTPANLGSIAIPAKDKTVPLLSLGNLKLETNPTVITREKGKRTISVSAAVAKGYSIPGTNSKLEKYADSINLPTGYSWQTGGVNDENNKSVQSILQAMVISFLLILITMVVEFRSFRQALIAMLLIPLSIAGVFYVFGLTGTPLSFPALIGLLALFGIVVTHAIVVIEKINENRHLGIPLKAAIVDASANRLEPVLLTSLATIVGLIPITLTDPLWRGLGGAIIAGLIFSGAIKLFFVPIMYYLMLREKEE